MGNSPLASLHSVAQHLITRFNAPVPVKNCIFPEVLLIELDVLSVQTEVKLCLLDTYSLPKVCSKINSLIELFVLDNLVVGNRHPTVRISERIVGVYTRRSVNIICPENVALKALFVVKFVGKRVFL